MKPHEGPPEDQRVLLLAPTTKDAAMTSQIFAAIGVTCTTCASVVVLSTEVERGAGAVVLTEHAITLPDINRFIELLRTQPPWSDLPIVLLAGGGANSAVGRRAMEAFGNVTVLERPVQMASLASVVRTLIRSRRRQYQIRAHLEERARLLEAERAARNEAERVSQVKDEFLATLSHELRTPLTAILGWSQVLANNGHRDERDLTEGLRTIERNACSQKQIIDDLLDMSRIINGKIRLDTQRIGLMSVIDAAIATVQSAADAKEIRIAREIDPHAGPIAGDPNRLQQVFWNLLSNAIKFTPRGGLVRVVLSADDALIEARVIDTGEGIPREFLPHVFDRFRQADATSTRRHGGLGLGLSIARQLIELHGGTIHARSGGPGKGSEFIVQLPVTTARLPSIPTESSGSAQTVPTPLADAKRVTLEGVKVLVVEDEPDTRAMLKRLLENRRATVATAASAADALRCLSASRPDVLISDIGMPVEDGYSLIRNIRSLPAELGGATPAIALTAYARPEDRARAFESGFHLHAAKPVQPTELIKMIASLARKPVTTADA